MPSFSDIILVMPGDVSNLNFLIAIVLLMKSLLIYMFDVPESITTYIN